MVLNLSTTYSPRLPNSPAQLHFPPGPADKLDLAARLDREADLHLSEGRGGTADRLAHAALELRCRVAGGLA